MRIILLVFFILSWYGMKAQIFPSYIVYLVRGDAKLYSSFNKIQSIKQGLVFHETDTIILGQNSEIQLIDKDAKLVRLITAGKYYSAGLKKMFHTSRPPGITTTYLKLVYEEVLDPHYDITHSKKNSIGGAYGGAARGTGDLIYPVDHLKTSEDSLRFLWHSKKNMENYNLLIYDDSGKIVYSFASKDTQQFINLAGLHSQTKTYTWRIKEFGSPYNSTLRHFDYLSKEDEEKELASFSKEASTDSLTAALDRLDELETNIFIEKAKTGYARLVQQNPANKALAKSYYLFLSRYGFDVEAKMILYGIKNN